MDKSPDAFRTISEVAEHLDTPAHVLRFWESRFPQIRPVKRAGGRRYYRPSDVALLTGIKRLLHDEGLTIRGVQKILREQGVRHVAGLTEEAMASEAALDALIDDLPGGDDVAVPDGDPPAAAILPFPVDPQPRAPEPAAEPALPGSFGDQKPAFSIQIRALPARSLTPRRTELADIAARLIALRTRLADRINGAPG